jgi:hypothetical protein
MKSAKDFWTEREKELIDKMGLKLMAEEKVYFANEMWEFAEAYHAQFTQVEVTDEDIEKMAKEFQNDTSTSFNQGMYSGYIFGAIAVRNRIKSQTPDTVK